MRILLADDDKVVLSFLSRLLTQSGHTAMAVGDGLSACEAAEKERPNLAIIDLHLPKRDGYAVLMQLRSRPGTRDLPVLLMSSEPRAEHEATALALGAQGLMQKPMKAEEILATIRRVAAGRSVSEVRT
jgi:twitching motility two-component system response regulator PilH